SLASFPELAFTSGRKYQKFRRQICSQLVDMFGMNAMGFYKLWLVYSCSHLFSFFGGGWGAKCLHHFHPSPF
ncbi:MAG: hypothetical protein KKI01_13550, partial [Proteobacteria bacterium]|nr:hypothetical protein [Pseudomonadota bacterium]